ncbi:uncharacterized protein LOC117568609 [Drosophila albomicans]|uniref:Uncharacterized protein LOC117568609 n=1 Tax=Drosophila albomicans TaxID=7291 RepID=A0A6P8WNJ3_DROAB|nr:uncharacterized protein LOC117568609 [Drosophila albomicans]
MLLNKTYRHCAAAVIVMGLAIATYAYDNYELQMFLHVVRGLQLVATAVLLFAIFKKEQLHKDKLILFWLGTTTFFEMSIAICSFKFIGSDFVSYTFGYFIGSLFALLAFWLAMAVVGYAMYIIYLEYVELIQVNGAGLSLPPVANQISPIYETKETPPPYIPTSENLSVSIQS